MAVSKIVACVNEECPNFGVVSEIPYAMLMSINEPVYCGGCMQETPEVAAETRAAGVKPINAEQVAAIAALGRTTFYGSNEPLPSPDEELTSKEG